MPELDINKGLLGLQVSRSVFLKALAGGTLLSIVSPLSALASTDNSPAIASTVPVPKTSIQKGKEIQARLKDLYGFEFHGDVPSGNDYPIYTNLEFALTELEKSGIKDFFTPGYGNLQIVVDSRSQALGGKQVFANSRGFTNSYYWNDGTPQLVIYCPKEGFNGRDGFIRFEDSEEVEYYSPNLVLWETHELLHALQFRHTPRQTGNHYAHSQILNDARIKIFCDTLGYNILSPRNTLGLELATKPPQSIPCNYSGPESSLESLADINMKYGFLYNTITHKPYANVIVESFVVALVDSLLYPNIFPTLRPEHDMWAKNEISYYSQHQNT